MTVYLLHIFGRLENARPGGGPRRRRATHHIGFTVYRRAHRRVGQHRAGCSGSKYMRQVRKEGLRFYLVREWIGADRTFERRLKDRRQGAAFCPWCKKHPGANRRTTSHATPRHHDR